MCVCVELYIVQVLVHFQSLEGSDERTENQLEQRSNIESDILGCLF